MAVVFDNPLFLYGTAAGAIPVLIHLLNRRRAKLRKFPSIRLIAESHKKVARHYRIRQWLLLALRVLSIAAIAFFLAGPQLVSDAEREAWERKKGRALLIIIDNSFSMSYRTDEGEYIERAKVLAREIIEELQPDARFAVVPLVSFEEKLWRFTPDAQAALRALSGIRISHGVSDMRAALNRAYASLKAFPREYVGTILIITDMTDLPWKDFSAAGLDFVDRDVRLKVVGLTAGRGKPNVYLQEVSHGRTTVGLPLAITARVGSSSGGYHDPLLVEFEVDGKAVQRRKVEIPSEGSTLLRMEYLPSEPGYRRAVLGVSDRRLTEDNLYYFTIPVEERTDVLVVGGDPRTSLLLNETYYLAIALDPGPPGDRSPLAPEVVTAGQFDHMGPYGADVIILANVEVVTEAARRQLLDYVLDGGNLVFFVGDRVDPERYNRDFHDSHTRLLPARLKAVAQAPARLWGIDRIDFSHPALAQFQGREGESLLNARFNRVMELDEKTVEPESRVLLTLDNGMPLLLERRLGRGRVLLFTSTADRDWNDLCTRGAYLPLIQGLMRYLVADDPGEFQPAGVAGSPLEIPVKGLEQARAVEVAQPDGDTLRADVRREGREALLRFTGRLPGFYRVRLRGGERVLALNASSEESRLGRISGQELRAKFGDVEIEVVSDPAGAREVLKGEGKKVGLAPALLLSMFLLLAAEGLTASRT